jgi:hypothetical protein
MEIIKFNFKANGGLSTREAALLPTKESLELATQLRQARFDETHYKEIRAEIERMANNRKVCSRLYARFVVSWLALYLDVDKDEVLHAIVGCYNRHGASYTAWVFYFSGRHKFDWLPKTGEQIPSGMAFYHGGMCKIPKPIWHLFPGMESRWVRAVPEDFELYPAMAVKLRAPDDGLLAAPNDPTLEGYHIWMRRARG